MKYPDLSEIPRTEHAVEGMIRDIAWKEATIEPSDHYRGIDVYSAQLGQMCVEALAGQRLRKPIDLYDKSQPKIALHFLETERRVINARYDSQKLELHQRRMHELAIQGIEQTIGSSNDISRGQLAEFTGLALLTRYCHPSMIAYPALPHHERDKDSGNHYDMSAVIVEPDNSTSSYYLQIKNLCFGACGRSRQWDLANAHRKIQRYRPIIQMVSGCCDLRLPSHRNATRKSSAAMLLREARDVADVNEIKALDTITDNLVFNMSANLLPRGKRRRGTFRDLSTYFDT